MLSTNPVPRTKVQSSYSEKLTIFRPLVAKITCSRGANTWISSSFVKGFPRKSRSILKKNKKNPPPPLRGGGGEGGFPLFPCPADGLVLIFLPGIGQNNIAVHA